jgi:hypothetical protein
MCGDKAVDVHHIVAKRHGGTDDESNLDSRCHRHHSIATLSEMRDDNLLG